MDEVRQLTADSISEVIAISLQIFSPTNPTERYHDPKVWKKYLEDGGILLGAFSKGNLVGYNFGYPMNEKEYHYWMGGILEEYRGQGLGKKLLHLQEKLAKEKGFNKITVNTYEHLWPVQFAFLKKYRYRIYKQEEKVWDGKKVTKSFFEKKF